MTGSLMRLAVGMTSSALRKHVSPVPRCFIATATFPLWAAASASIRSARAGDGSPAGAYEAAIKARLASMDLPGFALLATNRGEDVSQREPEARQYLAPEQFGIRSDFLHPASRRVNLGPFLSRVDHPRESDPGQI